MLNVLQQRMVSKRLRTFSHTLFAPNEPWPRRTDIACFHCCHQFDTIPLPGINRVEDSERAFGVFCSPQCFRAYAIDHRPLSWNVAVMYYSGFLLKHFGIADETQQVADPRERLQMFGGPLSIEEFRANFTKPGPRVRLEHPRFVFENPTFVEIDNDFSTGVSIGDSMADEPTRIATLTNELVAEEKRAPSRALLTPATKDGRAVASNSLSVFEQFSRALSLNDGDTEKAHQQVLRDAKEKSKIGAGGRNSAAAAAGKRAEEASKKLTADRKASAEKVKRVRSQAQAKKKRKLGEGGV